MKDDRAANLPWRVSRSRTGDCAKDCAATGQPWWVSRSATGDSFFQSRGRPDSCLEDCAASVWTVTADALLLWRSPARSQSVLFAPAFNRPDVVLLDVADLEFNFQSGPRIGLTRHLVNDCFVEANYFGIGVVLVGLLASLSWTHLGRVQCEVDDAHRELEISLEREQSFNRNVGHELRTPLAGIRSIIDVGLLYDKEADELRKTLSNCSSVVGNMEVLVGRLLLMSRLESQETSLRKEKIFLSETIDDWSRGKRLQRRRPGKSSRVH